jgi:hypothetical protein
MYVWWYWSSTVDGARANLGIANVDDTRDLLKPISMATQVGLDNKIDKVLKVPEIIVTSSTISFKRARGI